MAPPPPDGCLRKRLSSHMAFPTHSSHTPDTQLKTLKRIFLHLVGVAHHHHHRHHNHHHHYHLVGVGGMHFVYGASPHQILLHLPIILLHFPIKFASFPQQIASFPQQFASFPQQIASFPQHSFSLPQHILCHFAKHRIEFFSAISLVFGRFYLSPDSSIGD